MKHIIIFALFATNANRTSLLHIDISHNEEQHLFGWIAASVHLPSKPVNAVEAPNPAAAEKRDQFGHPVAEIYLGNVEIF